jgi:hypothetical protein
MDVMTTIATGGKCLHSLKQQINLRMRLVIIIFFLAALFPLHANDIQPLPEFRVIAFFSAKQDAAHISFVHEAHKWFDEMAVQHNFDYDSTSKWDNLNESFLSAYDVVIFLDTRPEEASQRKTFQKYMENGGAWLGFHFAGFALENSQYPNDWQWYHNQFLGTGEYKSNTWRPTAETLRVHVMHASCEGLPSTFISAPNEWYRWELDLEKNPDIDIILVLDENTFPVGTGPKKHEIWHSGFYPVAWANKKFRMIYLNMGHNDMDYGGTEKSLSSTFSSAHQSRFILQALLWLGKKHTR